jgi:hypothetical protein
MMEINNKHIVLMLLIIIIGVFIYNYDVYVIPKNEPLCKPVYVTKRELTPEIRAELNMTESEILKETFDNLADIEYFESFGNLDAVDENSSQYDVPPKSFGSFSIPSLTNQHKIKVIDSVIKILSYIPTNYCESQIKQMVEYFAIIYETSPDLESFYKNISSSTKIKESPYNSKYSHLILFLIGKFDDDYLSCPKPQNSDTQCAMNELLKEIINKQTTKSKSTNDETNNKNNKNDEKNSLDYLSEQETNTQNGTNNDANSFNPKQVLDMIEKSKGKMKNKSIKSNKNSSDSNIIMPKLSNSDEISYNEQNNGSFTNPVSNVPSYLSSNKTKFKGNKQRPQSTKCNGVKCTYECDSSYSNATSYLNTELKPMESFGNILDNYAEF